MFNDWRLLLRFQYLHLHRGVFQQFPFLSSKLTNTTLFFFPKFLVSVKIPTILQIRKFVTPLELPIINLIFSELKSSTFHDFFLEQIFFVRDRTNRFTLSLGCNFVLKTKKIEKNNQKLFSLRFLQQYVRQVVVYIREDTEKEELINLRLIVKLKSQQQKISVEEFANCICLFQKKSRFFSFSFFQLSCTTYLFKAMQKKKFHESKGEKKKKFSDRIRSTQSNIVCSYRSTSFKKFQSSF